MPDFDFGPLNSATKYPSIETYHALDPADGTLLEGQAMPFTGTVLLTEKVDGANGRIVLMPDGDWVIGSREEVLYARGDRIVNPAMSVVSSLLPLAQQLGDGWPEQDGAIYAFYLEVYGHRIGPAWKQYASTGITGCRLFDVAVIRGEVLSWPRERIASWREHGGQEFLSEAELTKTATWDRIPLTPRLGTVDAAQLPASLDGMLELLRETVPLTRVRLDPGTPGAAEGIVLRTENRSVIAKARFTDYGRTIRRRQAPQGKEGGHAHGAR